MRSTASIEVRRRVEQQEESRNRRRRSRGTVISIVVCLCSIGAIAGFIVDYELNRRHALRTIADPALVAATKARGDEIVRALKRYKEDHAAFPKSLRQLTPDYLPQLLPPLAGWREWEYQAVVDGSSFTLLFGYGYPRHFNDGDGWEREHGSVIGFRLKMRGQISSTLDDGDTWASI